MDQWAPPHLSTGDVTLSLPGANSICSVELVLFDEESPSRMHEVWSIDSVKLVVWTNGKSRAGPPLRTGWEVTRNLITHASLGGITDVKVWLYMAEHQLPPNFYSASDAFDAYKARGLTHTTLKEVLDPTAKGPSCGPPKDADEDAQWHKRKWKLARIPQRFPSVFSPTKFVRRALTPRELGGT
ncbi:hypothetical protein ACA910_003526 [Epithemia clementina (nom. ined.)]